MRKSMISFLAVLGVAAFFIGGCANNEAVKKDEPVVPVAIQKVEPAKPVEVAKPVEEVKPVEVAKPAEVAKPVEVAKPIEEVKQAAQAVSQAVKAGEEKPAPSMSKFETAYFDFDKSDLRQDARDVLSKNAEIILKSFATAKIQIEGHCDERGSAEYNLALGERRAKSAQKYLTTLGVKDENLSVISFGKEKPAVNGSDEAAWAKNRRAEFVVVK